MLRVTTSVLSACRRSSGLTGLTGLTHKVEVVQLKWHCAALYQVL